MFGMRIVAVGALAFVAMGTAEPVHAELDATRLRARVHRKHKTVKLSWRRVRGIPRRAIVLVELERATGSAAFEPLDVLPDRPRRYVDDPPLGATYRYRARLLVDTDTTPWSDPVEVEVPGDPTLGDPGGGDPPPGGDPPGSGPPLASGQSECAAGTVQAVLDLVNDARRDAGRPALALHSQLQWAARKRSIDMGVERRLSHDGWLDTVRASGYPGGILGENIALGYVSPGHVVGGWLGSSGHRANILGASYRHTGIGCVISGGTRWWTQDFGG